MGWQVIIAPSAQSDLADIVRYVASHNTDAAARLGFELITHAEGVVDFPEIGRRVPEFRQPDLRDFRRGTTMFWTKNHWLFCVEDWVRAKHFLSDSLSLL